MGRIKRNTYKLKNFFRNDIWEMELEELSKAKARFIKYVKVMLITIKTFANEKIGFQAVALSFFSTMSVVPFIAIMFAITGGLGLSDKLKELLYAYFNNICLNIKWQRILYIVKFNLAVFPRLDTEKLR